MADVWFNTPISRERTGSIKYDFRALHHAPPDALPLWVADMDFQAPQEVRDAMEAVVRHGIFGYTHSQETFHEAVHDWFLESFGWNVSREWTIQTPHVMFGIGVLLRAWTKPGDAVMVQVPVYDPFLKIVPANGRTLVCNRLVQGAEGRYFVDYETFEQQIVENDVRVFLLCSPHNPVGRVWSPHALRTMGEICFEHGVRVISDEIHADLVYPTRFPIDRHTVFASLGKEFQENSAVCTSPSKTFNLAGLHLANIFIPNEELRRAVRQECQQLCWYESNAVALAAAEAAYRSGRAWRDALLVQLQANERFLRERFQELHLPIRPVPLEGTYLWWLDCREMGLDDASLERFFLDDARLWLAPGTQYGPGGEGFMRWNLASPMAVMEEASRRLEKAFRNSPHLLHAGKNGSNKD
ncbi:MAG: MalY/PatB family protein [Planctomycetia bacterium]|nr:MalY/PatB family protein [Planctomycetia bacterium]